MFLAVDVDYREQESVVAGVIFASWSDAVATETAVVRLAEVAEYCPGEFYRRELPCIEALLQSLDETPEVIVVDGHVWLDVETPGLGKHLYDSLGSAVPVIGVAKSSFKGSACADLVLRGESERPLFVTSVGLDQNSAAEAIRGMHGEFRMPTLLKLVDRICRDA